MATLQELADLPENASWGDLVAKIRAALLIKAYNLTELPTPSQAQLDYATSVILDPGAQANQVAFYVVAANSGQTVANILGASDSAIQNNVNGAVDNLFTTIGA